MLMDSFISLNKKERILHIDDDDKTAIGLNREDIILFFLDEHLNQ